MINFTKIFKVASKSSIVRPELSKLYVKNNKIYATDSFKAVIMHTDDIEYEDENANGYITKVNASIADMKTKQAKVQVLPELTEDDTIYPDVERLLEQRKYTLSFNRQYLIDLLEAMQKGSSSDIITMHIPEEGKRKPLIFTNKNGTGLIMELAEY